MIKRELKLNFKSFAIWTGVLIGMFLLIFLMYPSIITNENIEMIDEFVAVLPEEMLKAFNMDLASIDSAYGWFKTEGYVMILLLIGCYSGILGSNILLKEEDEKTIEYLNSLPISRNKILLSKIFVGVFYIFGIVLALGVFNYIGLTLSGDFDQKEFLLLSIAPLFPGLALFFISMFIGTFSHKTKKVLGVSLGVVFISYILNIISTISEETEFLKYASVFTLSDSRGIITDGFIEPMTVLLSILISLIFTLGIVIRYNKKELI